MLDLIDQISAFLCIFIKRFNGERTGNKLIYSQFKFQLISFIYCCLFGYSIKGSVSQDDFSRTSYLKNQIFVIMNSILSSYNTCMKSRLFFKGNSYCPVFETLGANFMYKKLVVHNLIKLPPIRKTGKIYDITFILSNFSLIIKAMCKLIDKYT
ncbi:hypothetical protein BpHYR1_054148 [Brachionus plicatilis]|uniref:Uncharacterized protein n=1 Tax=Brachionus plicatilis TaxID=10195 RepID=A0A3M7S8X5_BRAPC|nr:hypothetical protein BpHYR1_054148 [Brachionus plicatilis]